ncbi:ATP-binding protein [Streptococcus suis]|nr:ATP-binding protein [Streptococcus suis]NQP01264.1 ATP-binding protein [Streptococcus suis]NQP29074.1 ATP-binding protein [Streptococcus suis]HEL1634139.1 ATP-binding protein [Streptococcus suis]HEM5466046.1 ATP-binding protein [Streptococcus suis]
MQITKGKRARAQRVVIYGPEGIGKSSLAAQFPNPLFIDTEGSTDNMDVARADKPTSWTMLINHIAFVKSNPTICQTLVIDTIDWAEALALQYICAQHNKSGIEDFGWGAGYTYLIEEIGRLLDRLQELVELGINVVLTAHAQVKKFTKPDELGGYDRYELKLSNKKTETNVSAKVKEWADMVLFLNYKTYIITDEKTKKQKAQGGQRVMQTTHSPSWDAKNRHNLPEELPMDFAGIAHIFTTQTQAQPTSVQEQPAHEPAHAVQEQVQEAVPTQPTQPAQTSDISPLIPQSLRDLMIGSKVTQDEVLQATYVNGIYPLGTQVEAIDAGYWEYMVTVWDKVLNVINTKVRTNPEMPFTVEGN